MQVQSAEPANASEAMRNITFGNITMTDTKARLCAIFQGLPEQMLTGINPVNFRFNSLSGIIDQNIQDPTLRQRCVNNFTSQEYDWANIQQFNE